MRCGNAGAAADRIGQAVGDVRVWTGHADLRGHRRTDLRKGFDGLYGLVRDRLECDPTSGHAFLFTNARRNRLKLLVWDHSGLWVCAKKLDRGCFRWPVADSTVKKVVLSHEELTLLLGGIDLAQTRPRKWYRKVPGKEPTESLKTA